MFIFKSMIDDLNISIGFVSLCVIGLCNEKLITSYLLYSNSYKSVGYLCHKPELMGYKIHNQETSDNLSKEIHMKYFF